jgi:hypothetical protein
VQTLSILDVELDKVKNGLAAAAVTAMSLASKSASKSSSSKEEKVKLPGALAASAEDPPGKCLNPHRHIMKYLDLFLTIQM